MSGKIGVTDGTTFKKYLSGLKQNVPCVCTPIVLDFRGGVLFYCRVSIRKSQTPPTKSRNTWHQNGLQPCNISSHTAFCIISFKEWHTLYSNMSRNGCYKHVCAPTLLVYYWRKIFSRTRLFNYWGRGLTSISPSTLACLFVCSLFRPYLGSHVDGSENCTQPRNADGRRNCLPLGRAQSLTIQYQALIHESDGSSTQLHSRWMLLIQSSTSLLPYGVC